MTSHYTIPQPRKAPKGSKITCSECRKAVFFRSAYYVVPDTNGTSFTLCHRCQHDWHIVCNAEKREGQTHPIAYGSLQDRINDAVLNGVLCFHRKSHKALARRWGVSLRVHAASRSETRAPSFPLTAQAVRQLQLIVPKVPRKPPDQGEILWLQELLMVLLIRHNTDASADTHWARIVRSCQRRLDPIYETPTQLDDLKGCIAWLASYLEQVATPPHIRFEEAASYA